MRIQTLENIDQSTIRDVFNESFSDYIVPFHLTAEQFENKLKGENVNLELSAGAFEGDRLIGFILHGEDILDGHKMAYNAGTGVIPTKRGQKITGRLYEYNMPILQSKGIDKIYLEAIIQNTPAIKTYRQIGFHINRKLNCYKGTLLSTNIQADFSIEKLKAYDWNKLQSFWDWKPSWSNSVPTLERLSSGNMAFGIYQKNILAGYMIYNPSIKRIQQFAIDKPYRNKGMGKKLFHHMAELVNHEISIVNVDEGSTETNIFLKELGFQPFIQQYEMEINII